MQWVGSALIRNVTLKQYNMDCRYLVPGSNPSIFWVAVGAVLAFAVLVVMVVIVVGVVIVSGIGIRLGPGATAGAMAMASD